MGIPDGRIPALAVTEPPALTRRGINDARGFGPKSAEQLERQFAVAQPIQLSGSRVLIPVFRVECFRTGTPRQI